MSRWRYSGDISSLVREGDPVSPQETGEPVVTSTAQTQNARKPASLLHERRITNQLERRRWCAGVVEIAWEAVGGVGVACGHVAGVRGY